MRAEQRQVDLGVLPAQALDADLLPADGDPALEQAELGALAATVASTSTARRTSASRAPAGCVGEHRDDVGPGTPSSVGGAGLMMPAFSVAMVATSGPRYSAWSSDTGVTTATRASATFVASQVPPMPTSTTATSTGVSAKAA